MSKASTLRRRLLGSAAGALMGLAATGALALPQGPTVSGPIDPQNPAATFTVNGNTLTVDQNTQRVVIDWRTFDIAAGETVNFQQDAANWIAFNRVGSTSPTTISGAINAQGGVWVMAPNGLIIGNGAVIDVGSFVGTTATSNTIDNLLNGEEIFLNVWNGNTPTGRPLTVEAGATITANNGFVVLADQRIVQNGNVSASDRVAYSAFPGLTIELNDQSPNEVYLLFAGGAWIGGQGVSQITHGGVTQAGYGIEINARQGDLAPGGSAIINLSGTLTALDINNVGGDVFEIAVFGNGADGVMEIDTSGAQINSGGNVRIYASSILNGVTTLGEINADDSITIYGGSGIVTTAGLTAGQNVTLDALNADLTVGGAITAGTVELYGGDVLINAPINATAMMASAQGLLDVASAIETTDHVSLTGGELLNVTGSVQAGGYVDLGGGRLTTGSQSRIAAAGEIDAFFNGDITLQGEIDGAASVDLFGATITQQGGLTRAGVDVLMEADDAIDISGTVRAGRYAALDADLGPVTIRSDSLVVSEQVTTINGGQVVMDAGATLQVNNGTLYVFAEGDVLLDPNSLLLAGVGEDNLTGSIYVQGGSDGPGNVELGRSLSRGLFVYTNGSPTGGGHITLASDIYATDYIQIFANGVGVQSQNTAGVDVLGDVISDGFIDLENIGSGALNIAPGSRIDAGAGFLFLWSSDDLIIGDGAQISATGTMAVQANNTLTIGDGATVTLNDGMEIIQDGSLILLPNSAYSQNYGIEWIFGALSIGATDIDLRGTVSALGPDSDIVLSLFGDSAIRIGGTDGVLSNAEFQRLSADDLFILAGHGEGTEGGTADLIVGDLEVNGSRLNGLWLGTGGDNTLTIAGDIALTGEGGASLQIGFAREASYTGGNDVIGGLVAPGAEIDGFVPGTVIINGSIGSADRPFDQVAVVAKGDILMGSAGFVDAALDDPTFVAKDRSTSFTDIEADHVFIASEGLQLAAMGRIIQQNTSRSGSFAGLVITAPTAERPLLYVPNFQDVDRIGGPQGWTPNYEVGPTRVELFGQLRGEGAPPNIGDAAKAANLVSLAITTVNGSGGDDGPVWQFNACDFGAEVCGRPPVVIRFDPPPPIGEIVQVLDGADLADASASSGSGGETRRGRLSSSFPLAQTEDNAEERFADQPVAGSGNVDLWSGPGQEVRP